MSTGVTSSITLIQALRIAARNAKNVRFDDCYYKASEQKMVREVPDYARQYLIEHPEFGPPLNTCGAGAPAREGGTNAACSADTPVREAATKTAVQHKAQAEPVAAQKSASQESVTAEPAAKRRQSTPHDVSRGSRAENHPAPEERKNPRAAAASGQETPPNSEHPLQENELKRVEAALDGAQQGNWRDLRTVFEFAGIAAQGKEAPS